jgi:hypothetical protein
VARAARHLVTTAVGSVGERGDAVLCAVVVGGLSLVAAH